MKRLLLFLAFAAAAFAQHSNTLTWTWAQGSGDPATGFHVWKVAGTSAPVTTGTPYAVVSSPTTLTYVDTAEVGGQTFTYVVTAFNTGGDSVPSNSVTCTTPFQDPNPPASLSGVSK
jgi:hypothetical protein